MRVVEWNDHPFEPAIYTALFHDPDRCEERSIYYREKLSKYTEQITEAYQGERLLGLYFQHTALVGRIMIALFIMISFLFADLWSVKRSDVNGGFGVGQYILTIIPIILLFFNRKNNS